MSFPVSKDVLQFSIGEVYFSTYFADNDLLFPFIGSYVYIGRDLLGNEKKPTWYFQDCESFARHGSFLNGQQADREILGLTEDAARNAVTLDQMVIELRRAETRRQAHRPE